jgi:hypothetical protein
MMDGPYTSFSSPRGNGGRGPMVGQSTVMRAGLTRTRKSKDTWQ